MRRNSLEGIMLMPAHRRDAGWPGEEEAPVSSQEEKNKALVRRFFKTLEEVSRGKAALEALDEMLAPDFVGHYKRIPGQQPGRDGYKRALAELRVTASNTSYLIEDQVAGEDKVVT